MQNVEAVFNGTTSLSPQPGLDNLTFKAISDAVGTVQANGAKTTVSTTLDPTSLLPGN